MLNKLSKEELNQLKDTFTGEKELSVEDLDIIKGGIPYEAGKQIAEENPEIFRSK